MSEPTSDWAAFYHALNKIGPRLLRNVHPAFEGYIAMAAADSDACWSDGPQSPFDEWWETDPATAIKHALEYWVENAKEHLQAITGQWSLIPFDDYGVSPREVEEWHGSVDSIWIDIPEDCQRLFVDVFLIEVRKQKNGPELLIRTVIQPYGKTTDGKLVRALALPWHVVAQELSRDWSLAHQIPADKWEELIAAAFDREGYDEVVLTPRSGDFGRDVIATRRGVGCVRIIGSVKAYHPGKLVRYDDVRALAGVLAGDPSATKAILTTTSGFPPGILKDSFIGPFIPNRIELMDGNRLRKWLSDLALPSMEKRK